MRRRFSLSAVILAAFLCLTVLPLAGEAHSPTASVRVPSGWPRYFGIPRFGVRASVESVAFDRSVDVEAPFHWGDVAWYNRGPKPGDQGHAVIYGHVDSTCCPAVFWHLKDLRRGDIVTVWYRKGRPLSFKIQWLHTYPNVQVPMKWIYSSTKQRALVLETCAGVFHRDGTGYDHKLVAYATMVTRRH